MLQATCVYLSVQLPSEQPRALTYMSHQLHDTDIHYTWIHFNLGPKALWHPSPSTQRDTCLVCHCGAFLQWLSIKTQPSQRTYDVFKDSRAGQGSIGAWGWGIRLKWLWLCAFCNTVILQDIRDSFFFENLFIRNLLETTMFSKSRRMWCYSQDMFPTQQYLILNGIQWLVILRFHLE